MTKEALKGELECFSRKFDWSQIRENIRNETQVRVNLERKMFMFHALKEQPPPNTCTYTHHMAMYCLKFNSSM